VKKYISVKVSNKVTHYKINNPNSPYRMIYRVSVKKGWSPEDTWPECCEEPMSIKCGSLKWKFEMGQKGLLSLCINYNTSIS